jgi:hypothetical protein
MAKSAQDLAAGHTRPGQHTKNYGNSQFLISKHTKNYGKTTFFIISKHTKKLWKNTIFNK